MTARAFAGGDLRPASPRSAGMAGSGCALAGNPGLNPALLAGCASGGSVSWIPSRFGFTELGSASAAWVQPFDALTARAAVQHFGYAAYREMRLEAGAGMAAGEMLRIGFTTGWNHAAMDRYGSAAALGIDAGIVFAPAKQVACGAVVENALQLPFTEGERLPLRIRMGVAWTSGPLAVVLDVEKESRFALTTRVGMEYHFEHCVFLRAGFGSAPGTAAGGFGLRHAGWTIGYAVEAHPDLGWTHTAGIGFQP